MCFEKNLWKFKQILKVFFKENVNKNLEKSDENYNLYYYLFLLLAEAWVVFHLLQFFRGFEGRKLPTFPLATPLIGTTENCFYILKVEAILNRLAQKLRKLKILIQFLFNYRQDIFEKHVITMTKIDININILIY